MEDKNIESRLAGAFEGGTPMEFDIVNDDALSDVDSQVDIQDDNNDDDYPDNNEPTPNPEPAGAFEEEEDDFQEFEQEYTQAAILAESYKQEGVFPEDMEIPPDFTGQQLQQALFEHTAKKLEENRDAYYAAQGYSPEVLEIAALMGQGIDPQVIWEAMQNKDLSTLDIEQGEDAADNRALIIQEMYKDKGLSDKRIKMLLEDLQDAGEDIEEAKIAKQYFEAKYAQRIEYEKQLQAQQQQAMLEAEQRRQEQLQALVNEGNFYGLTLESEKDKQEFMDFLSKPNEIIRTEGPDGKPIAYRVSGYEKKMYELEKDPKKQLAFARLLQMDFNLSDLEQRVSVSTQEDILNKLNAKTTKKVIKRGAGSSIPGGSIQSRPVAEFDI